MNLNYKFFIIFFATLVNFLAAPNVVAEQTIRFVEATGRSVIQDENKIADARRTALEDAIFLAAVQGGAQVNGFSAVDMHTTIADHFTVQPSSKILDFDILNEAVKGEHYEISIKAAVGDLTSKQCSLRSMSSITKYAAEFKFSPEVPAWLRELAREINFKTTELLNINQQIMLTDATETVLNIDRLPYIEDDFDYTALTRGRVRVANGDFAYVPEIRVSVTRSKKNIETEVFLHFRINSKLFHGVTYNFAGQIEYETVIKLRSKTPWRTFDILSKKTNDQIKNSIMNGIDEHMLDLIDQAKCAPLSANLQINNGRLVVELGRRHGLSANTLAIATGTNTPYTIMHIIGTTDDVATLEPLNKATELSSLVGKKIEFLELIQ